MTTTSWLRVVIVIGVSGTAVHAHSGPPFPIVEDRIVGAYQVSLWADPDATDDQSAAGKFWVMLRATRSGQVIPAGTDVQVRIRPLDRAGGERLALAEPIAGDGAIMNENVLAVILGDEPVALLAVEPLYHSLSHYC